MDITPREVETVPVELISTTPTSRWRRPAPTWLGVMAFAVAVTGGPIGALWATHDLRDRIDDGASRVIVRLGDGYAVVTGDIGPITDSHEQATAEAHAGDGAVFDTTDPMP
ncbi:hypothetical protein [Cellulomonas hominis]